MECCLLPSSTQINSVPGFKGTVMSNREDRRRWYVDNPNYCEKIHLRNVQIVKRMEQIEDELTACVKNKPIAPFAMVHEHDALKKELEG
jgi:hypothetical protein